MLKILIGIPTFDRRIDIDLMRCLINLERENKYHLDFLFPHAPPGQHRVGRMINVLLLDVAVMGIRQIGYLRRAHAEETTDFQHTKLP